MLRKALSKSGGNVMPQLKPTLTAICPFDVSDFALTINDLVAATAAIAQLERLIVVVSRTSFWRGITVVVTVRVATGEIVTFVVLSTLNVTSSMRLDFW
mmetsp:Transcript_42365/g.78502  ORF Transcript_42365/g.78502 Transcript_42365/m.78502 type:complete len:99 (+) Transcript_42365:612-908(+)